MRPAILIAIVLLSATVEAGTIGRNDWKTAKKKAAAVATESSDFQLPYFLQFLWPPNATNAKYLAALVAFIWCFLLSSLR